MNANPLVRSVGVRSVVWLIAPLVLAAAVWNVEGAPVQRSWSLTNPLTGEAVELETRARALHLVFFASWCPPCMAELDRLAEIEARWAGQGYRLVLVAVQTRQTAERLAQFAGSRRPPGELLFDANGKIQKDLAVKQLPTHMLFDASGVEVLRREALDEQIEAQLEQVLARRSRP